MQQGSFRAEVEVTFARIAKFRDAEAERRRASVAGTHWSGMEGTSSAPLATDAELMERARKEVTARRAFRATPVGRFYFAVCDLEAAGFDVRDLLGFYGRSDRFKFNPAEAIAGCRRILSTINIPEAREAERALDDIAGARMAEAA